MTRFLQMIAAVIFGLFVLLFSGPVNAQAQAPRGGTDTILFLAATRGYDLNNNGLHEWCWVQQGTGEVWHGRFQNGLDEVPQTGQYQVPPTDPAVYCPRNLTEKVDLTT